MVALLFCYVYGIFINRAFRITSSPRDALFLLLLCPLHVGYLFYGLFGVSVFVVMASAFLHIRQQHQLKRLQTIEHLLKQHQQNGAKLSPVLGLGKCWLQYLSVNRSIVGLMQSIEKYSDLWRFSLTVYLGGFITLQCYAVYIVFFMRAVSVASKFLFFYGLVEVAVFQCLLIHLCAKLASTSSAIERENQKLGFLFSRFYLKRSSLESVDLRNLLKVLNFFMLKHKKKFSCYTDFAG